MSIYSITEDSTARDTFNIQRLNKFNRFYLLKNNFSCKLHLLNPAITNSLNRHCRGIFDIIPLTPTKVSKTQSQIYNTNQKIINSTRRTYKNLNSARIKKKI